MLNANKEKLHSFLNGQAQYKIPFFQRSYVWKDDNWSELWDNIKELLTDIKSGENETEHFIGTVIVKQAVTERIGSLVYDLIDGQQRLTTVCLLLRALHDRTEDLNLRNYIISFLLYVDSYGKRNIRIIHSKVDTEYFSDILLSENDNEGLADNFNNIVKCYLYFKQKIETEVAEEDIRTMLDIILDKLPVIHMALSKTDDVQQIFDTINSLGVRLTTGELLKNHLYSFPQLEPKFQEYWADVFEADEDAVLFWNEPKTAGRLPRTTIELFLYSFLIIKNETIVKIETLFKEYKEYIKNKTPDLVEFAAELKEYAELYAEMPDGKNISSITFSDHEKRFFHVMNELDITTVFPLVLFVYKNVTDKSERQNILSYLESYLVRRTVCKLTTKNYNNLFISIIVDLNKNKTVTFADFKNKLLSYTEDTNRFPNDEEFESAFNSNHLINQYAAEVLFCIALYQLNDGYADNSNLSNYNLTLEHIMPKKWRNHWQLPEDILEYDRDSKLLTLGNLTLVTGKLNSSMRDAAWVNKQEVLDMYSRLRITSDYIDYEIWDEEVIELRASNLFNTALLIWPI